MRTAPIITVVDPTADLQAAVDATPNGGILRLGIGTFTVPTGGLLITKGITIEGSGTNFTIIQAYSVAASQPVIRFAKSTDPEYVGQINAVAFRDFAVNGRGAVLDNAPAVYAGSYGIRIDLAASQLVRHVSLERLFIHACSSAGLYVTGNGADTSLIGLRVRDCIINDNWGDGAYVQGATLVRFDSNLFANNYGRGCCFESCSPTVTGDYYENNCHSALLTAGYDGQLRCYSGVINLSGLTFEAFNTDTGSVYLRQQATQVGLSLQTVSGSVRGCKFYNTASNYGLLERGMFVDCLNPCALEIGCNSFDGCEIAIQVATDATDVASGYPAKLTILQQHIGSYSGEIRSNPGISIPTEDSAPTMYARNAGQMLYDTSRDQLVMWGGTGWQSVVAGAVSCDDELVFYEDEPVTY